VPHLDEYYKLLFARGVSDMVKQLWEFSRLNREIKWATGLDGLRERVSLPEYSLRQVEPDRTYS
jgi:hypothetical protein